MIHSSSFQGLPTVLVDTPLARCEIALFGAQVLSYIPKADGRDVLWCSASRLKSGKPVRGGIPICWPWFAKQNVSAQSAQHGFVRTLDWRLSTQTNTPSGEVKLRFEPGEFPVLPTDSSVWPKQCRVSLEISIGATLEQTLLTQNNSDQTLTLTQALHSYFRVSDVRKCAVDGLQDREYLDKLLNFASATQTSAWQFEDSCDRIYLDTTGQTKIVDPIWRREIHIDSRRSASTVVWNPGAHGVLSFDDIPPTDWPQYLCIEVANCSPRDSVQIAPGTSHAMQQTIRVTPLVA
jgi:glucose-6-phosphate 1-epimerase